jgi:hypothetical protein
MPEYSFFGIKMYRIMIVLFVLVITMVSCIKIELPFGRRNSGSNGNTRELAGIEYAVINSKNYAEKMKAGEIGTGEKYVIDGLVLSVSNNTLMLQQAGLTNIFTLDEPIELTMGTKIRIYVEVKMVNTLIINASEAKVIKLEKI